MTIDICIPVYRPDKKLKHLFDMLSAQTVKPNNLIIMYTQKDENDHLEKEYTDRIVGNYEVYEVDRSDFDHGGTRALAVEYSKSEIFIMMTQDAVPKDRLLIEKLTKIFENNGTVAAAYARQMATDKSGLTERFTRSFNYPEESVYKTKEDMDKMGIKAFFCSNVCAAYRRDIYNKLGGFTKKTVFNEDMIYAYKVIIEGYGILYAADAKVIHTHEYSAMQQFHRNFDLGVSQAMYSEVFDNISSESEGFKYIKSAYDFFKKENSAFAVIPFIWGCCFKYAGFIMGKNYKKLPYGIIVACGMNKDFYQNNNLLFK
ncbi:MAG: glycosyltransferase [Lachnospiraceae bacterium]|nr:glycosyltransferase [Lachnospiraceae bacterium]